MCVCTGSMQCAHEQIVPTCLGKRRILSLFRNTSTQEINFITNKIMASINHNETSFESSLSSLSTSGSSSLPDDSTQGAPPASYVNSGANQNDQLDNLRPPAIFAKGYRELVPYEKTTFGEVTLKKTKNGQRAKSGVKIERDISPCRTTIRNKPST